MLKTFQQLYFKSLDRELIRRGIWGKSARQLKQELLDHLIQETENQIADGKNEKEAEAIAMQKLGTPAEVAEAGQMQIAQASWFGRHPWLGGLLILLLGTGFVHALEKFAFGPLFMHLRTTHSTGAAVSFACLMSEGTRYLAALVLITWLSIRPRSGWNHLLVTTTAIALAFSNLLSGIQSIFILSGIPGIFTHDTHGPLQFIVALVIFAWIPFGILCFIPWIMRSWKLRRQSKKGSNNDPAIA